MMDSKSFAKHFASLVASERGNLCSTLSALLRTELFNYDKGLEETKNWILKNEDLWPRKAKAIRKDLGAKMLPIFRDMSKEFYKSKIHSMDEFDSYELRIILENAMNDGYWMGNIGNA